MDGEPRGSADPRDPGDHSVAHALAPPGTPVLLGLGDVHELIRWALVVACVLDTISEATLETPYATRNAVIAAISAVALALNRRIGAAITAAGLLFTLHTSHEFLVLSIAAILAIFPSPKQLNLLVKVQITAVWCFAGIAKLEPGFRTGEVLQGGHIFLLGALPISVLVWGTILAEAIVLPVLLWTRPRIAMWAAVAFQSMIIIGMSTFRSAKSAVVQVSFVTALWSFGLLVIACVVAVTTYDRRTASKPPAF